jgi:MFS superfamily sulfate permease-like transporter
MSTTLPGLGEQSLVVLAIITGIVMLLFGLFKLGSLIRFVTHAVTNGFVYAVALLVILGQINDPTGLNPGGRYPDASGDLVGQSAANFTSSLFQLMLPGGSFSAIALVTNADARSRFANIFLPVLEHYTADLYKHHSKLMLTGVSPRVEAQFEKTDLI